MPDSCVTAYECAKNVTATNLRLQADDAIGLIEQRVRSLSRTQQSMLAASGIAGTVLRYRFSFEVARWLARTSPGAVTIERYANGASDSVLHATYTDPISGGQALTETFVKIEKI